VVFDGGPSLRSARISWRSIDSLAAVGPNFLRVVRVHDRGLPLDRVGRSTPIEGRRTADQVCGRQRRRVVLIDRRDRVARGL
jgi:hypothetical protein